jgi:hypothetical protein
MTTPVSEPTYYGPVWRCAACTTGAGECSGWSEGWCAIEPGPPPMTRAEVEAQYPRVVWGDLTDLLLEGCDE